MGCIANFVRYDPVGVNYPPIEFPGVAHPAGNPPGCFLSAPLLNHTQGVGISYFFVAECPVCLYVRCPARLGRLVLTYFSYL